MSVFTHASVVDPQLHHVASIVRKDVALPVILEVRDGATRAREDEARRLGVDVSYRARFVPQLHGEVSVEDLGRLSQSGVARRVWYDRPQYVFDDSFFSSAADVAARLSQRARIAVAAPPGEHLTGFLGGVGPFGLTRDAATLGLDDVRGFVRSAEFAASDEARGRGVKVALLDTGADESHDMLREAVVAQESFVAEAASGDKNGHGSWCASCIAGRPVEYAGRVKAKVGATLQGMAPEASLFVAKVLNGEGAGATSSIIQGVEWAVEQKVDVLSMSLGSFFGEAGLAPDARVVDEAAKRGVRCVIAAGNSFVWGTVGSPASAAGAITVGSVAMMSPSPGVVSAFSSKGPTSVGRLKPDVAAPGGNVHPDEVILGAAAGQLASEAGEGYALERGTSMATPAVAGVIAQLVPFGFPSDRGKVESVLAAGSRATASPRSRLAWLPRLKNNRVGWGIVDAVGLRGALSKDLPGFPVRDIFARLSGSAVHPALGFLASSTRLFSGPPPFDPSVVRLTLV